MVQFMAVTVVRVGGQLFDSGLCVDYSFDVCRRWVDVSGTVHIQTINSPNRIYSILGKHVA